MKRILLCGLVAAALPAGARALRAQTTDTERAAAPEVVAAVDSLEARLKPQELAKRIVGHKDADRDRILQSVEQLWNGGLQAASDWIAQHPEVGFEEFRAVDTLTKLAQAHGFTVQTGTAGLKTAFVGNWDAPAGADGPMLGVILEYDALRGTQGAFHGDQHNAQGPVGLAAAFAIADYMKEKNLHGRVRVFGTPAEEVGPPSKTAMLEAGAVVATGAGVGVAAGAQPARRKANTMAARTRLVIFIFVLLVYTLCLGKGFTRRLLGKRPDGENMHGMGAESNLKTRA